MARGDAGPRMEMWLAREDPVSLLGAWGPNKTGWDVLSQIFPWVAARLAAAEVADFRFDVEGCRGKRGSRLTASATNASPRCAIRCELSLLAAGLAPPRRSRWPAGARSARPAPHPLDVATRVGLPHLYDTVGSGTWCDPGGTPIDGTLPDAPSLVVSLVTRPQQRPPKAGA
jgi:hypothetical protein